ncbi:MAG: hypothetical protein LUO89_09410, partial [Methanothrix sp.]|nr:hypothetical protein [Methanothrix sp.]
PLFVTRSSKSRLVSGARRSPAGRKPCSATSQTRTSGRWRAAASTYLDVGGRMPQLLTIPGSVPVRRIDLATGQTTTVGSEESSLPGGVSVPDVTRDGTRRSMFARAVIRVR